MSDVLTAEQIHAKQRSLRVGDKVVLAEAYDALARSHEQLRAERDGAVQAGMEHEQRLRSDLAAAVRERDEARAANARGDDAIITLSKGVNLVAAQRDASAATAAAAIDALRQIADELGDPDDWPTRQPVSKARDLARAAVDAYETAVLGHATPAAADEERQGA